MLTLLILVVIQGTRSLYITDYPGVESYGIVSSVFEGLVNQSLELVDELRLGDRD